MTLLEKRLNANRRLLVKTLFPLLFITFLVMTTFGSAIEADAKEASKQVNIMTYNIQYGEGQDNGIVDLERIAKQIRKSDADIVGLQEVDNHWSDRSNFMDEAKELADMLDMEYVFGANLDKSPAEGQTHNRQYGTAILSKYPILDSHNYKLTKLYEDREQRGLLEAQIDVKGEEVWFHVTHLDHEGGPGGAERTEQVKDVIELTSNHDNKIVVGDMNAELEAPELQPFFQNFNDAWSTLHDSEGYTFRSSNPDRRLDYILTDPEIELNSSQVIHTLASDHFPVNATITLQPGEHPLNSSGLKKLVQYLDENDLITEDQTTKSLTMHLTAVEHFENTDSSQKVIKHLNGFKVLLDQKKQHSLIADEAYQRLKTDSDYLLQQWRDN